MTRSSELWIDGNTGHDFFLEPSLMTHHDTLSRFSRSQMCMFRQLNSGVSKNTQAESRQQDNWFTRQTSAPAFHNFCRDDHEISAPPLGWEWFADLHMISSGVTYDFVKINLSLVVLRQVSPIWLTRCCLLGSWVGPFCYSSLSSRG